MNKPDNIYKVIGSDVFGRMHEIDNIISDVEVIVGSYVNVIYPDGSIVCRIEQIISKEPITRH